METTKYNMKITEIVTNKTPAPVRTEMTAGGTGAGSFATVPATGGGSLFGGGYENPNNPFKKRARKKK
jgi:hypothetical protein